MMSNITVKAVNSSVGGLPVQNPVQTYSKVYNKAFNAAVTRFQRIIFAIAISFVINLVANNGMKYFDENKKIYRVFELLEQVSWTVGFVGSITLSILVFVNPVKTY